MLERLKTHFVHIENEEEVTDYAHNRLDPLHKYIKDDDGIKWQLKIKRAAGSQSGEDIYTANVRLVTAKKNYGASAKGSSAEMAIDEVKQELEKKITHHSDKKMTLLKRGGRLAKRMLRQGS